MNANVLYHSLLGLASPQQTTRSIVRDGKYWLKWIAAQWHSWTLARLPGLILVCFGWFGCVVSCSQMRGVRSTHLIGRTHFHDAQTRRRSQNPPLQKSSAIPALSVAFKTTFEVSTRAGPDNSLERFTERSVGLVTDRPSDVYELLVTLL